MRTGLIVGVLLAAGFGVMAAPAGSASRARGVSVSVVTQPGTTDAVARTLRARGIKIDRRVGRRLQVVARTPSQRSGIARVPGVMDIATAPSSYADAVIGQGVDRTGASALADVSNGGAGLTIAILDLGFGTSIPGLQARGELPPNARLILRSFDPAAGLAGTNAYGNPTDHGELVAQTVYDYAPLARYLFVNYHTPDDFVTAVDWVATQRVDIAVHSNNFLDGPFDGTSPMAKAVDRAAAAGVLWFNSAGNYGEKHWAGAWRDIDGDDVHDWPSATPWTVTHDVGEPLTFHLSWRNPPGAPASDIDLFLERQDATGAWGVVASSTGRQRDGLAPVERINGYRPLDPGTFRLRARRVWGTPPAGDLHLYSREDDVIGWAGTGDGSVPTPADAAGSVAVGAVDWRSNSLVRYSSRGPTADGRPKPELVAPTGTRLATAGGDPRDVGGTSIAAPNAAGAAAAVLASMRQAGLRPTPTDLRAILARDAVDLGEPGSDTRFGAGRIRVDTEPPVIRAVTLPPPNRPSRGVVRFSLDATDAGPVTSWGVLVNGVEARRGRVARERINIPVATRGLPDGVHQVTVEIGDSVGNVGRRTWQIVSDNTAPTLDTLEVVPGRARQVFLDGRLRTRVPVAVTVGVSDLVATTVSVEVALIRVPGGLTSSRAIPVRSGIVRRFGLAPVPKGRYVIRVTGTDVAGNRMVSTQRVTVTG